MQNDVVKNAIDSLLIAKSALEKQLEGVNLAIKTLGGEINNNTDPVLVNSEKGYNSTHNVKRVSDYSKDWGLANKFLYLLKKEQRFLHFRESADLIIQLEGSGETNELAGKLSSATNALKKSGQIIKFQPTNRNRETFWGIPKWLDENGNVKSGHEINKAYLLSSSTGPKIDI